VTYYLEDGLVDCADLDPCTVWSKKEVRARKTWKCFECNHPIVPGEKHWHLKYLFEGAWNEERFCLCCENARCALAEIAGQGMCILTGSLWATAEMMVEEGMVTQEDLDKMRVA
jgi:hypothetical protein